MESERSKKTGIEKIFLYDNGKPGEELWVLRYIRRRREKIVVNGKINWNTPNLRLDIVFRGILV